MTALDRVHGTCIAPRRIRILAGHLERRLPPGASVLDVGCGDGLVGRTLIDLRPDLAVTGVEVRVRAKTRISVGIFDGLRIPCADKAVDVALLVDVLHHAAAPGALLREAARVARTAVVVKDHTREGFLAEATLRFMDRVGNLRFGVPVTGQYWSRAEWDREIARAGLSVADWTGDLGLYPIPFRWMFDRSLHFVARLDPAAASVRRLAEAP